jgi:hypothetical protein
VKKNLRAIDHTVADNERLRLGSLPGFRILERQLEADLGRLVDQYAAWRVSGPVSCRISAASDKFSKR